MIWLLIIPLIFLWAWTQKLYVDATGERPPSRRALRRHRRRARDLGIPASDLPYRGADAREFVDGAAWVKGCSPCLAGATILLWIVLLYPW